MQLIGIYLGSHNNPVSKNLRENWYPFGNFDNCHVKKNIPKVLQQVKDNQAFINTFYNIDQKEEKQDSSRKNEPSINLNCIVGKNGSGKSTILSVF